MEILDLYQKYLEERKKWKDAGSPIRSQEEKTEIYSICQACPHFKKRGGHVPGYDQCGICGCNLHPTKNVLNKIAWGTTQCPDSPSRWGPEDAQEGP